MSDRIPALLEPIQNRLGAANDYPGLVTIAESQEDTARLLSAVQAVLGEIAEIDEETGSLGLDLQEDDFDRGWYGARREAVERIRNAVVAALGGEA